MPKDFSETKSPLVAIIAKMDPAQAKADLYHILHLLRTNLVNACDWLARNVPREYRLRSVSGVLEKQLEVCNRQSTGKPVVLSTLEAREGIYEQARTVHQLRAFAVVNSIVVRNFASDVISACESGRFLAGRPSLRALIERASLLHALVREVSPIGSLEAKKPTAILALHNAGEIVARALYSTRVNWSSLLEKDPKDISKNDLKFDPIVGAIVLTAETILKQIDKLGNAVPGIRVAYEFLCEFAHPNYGDLIFATSAYEEEESDWCGIRVRTRVIGHRNGEIELPIDYTIVFGKMLKVCAELSQHVISDHRALADATAAAEQMVRSYMRSAIKKNRDAFRKTDMCPCGSEK
jgi:hypothetical protein